MCRRSRAERAYLVRKGQRQLDLVRGDIGVASTGKGSSESGRADAQGGAGDTEGVHDERRSSEGVRQLHNVCRSWCLRRWSAISHSRIQSSAFAATLPTLSSLLGVDLTTNCFCYRRMNLCLDLEHRAIANFIWIPSVLSMSTDLFQQ